MCCSRIKGSCQYYNNMLATAGGGNEDRFRIKIWDIATELTIYDNQAGSDDAAELDEFTVIQGGHSVIHKK